MFGFGSTRANTGSGSPALGQKHYRATQSTPPNRPLACFSLQWVPAVFKDAFDFVLVPPSPGGSRGRVRTVVFLQKLGFWAGSGGVVLILIFSLTLVTGGSFNFDFEFDLKYGWVVCSG